MPRHQRVLDVVVVLRDARSLRDHLERHERFCDTSRRPLRRIRSHARVLAISRRVVRDIRHRVGGWKRVWVHGPPPTGSPRLDPDPLLTLLSLPPPALLPLPLSESLPDASDAELE